MKKISIRFFQLATVLIGIVVLFILVRFPLYEGRAKNLDLFSIYADPFILYAYTISILFFIGLYQTFKLLGYIGRDKIFTYDAIKALKSVKLCAIIMGISIVLAGVYIKVSHHQDDDPAGFLAMCIIATLICGLFAATAAVFEKKIKNTTLAKS